MFRAPPEKRYYEATFETILPGGEAQFLLNVPPVPGRKQARVPAPDVPEDAGGWRRGTTMRLFVERLSGSGSWICRLWDEAANPWLNGQAPSTGDVVLGTVIAFSSPDSAIVRLDDTSIDAHILREGLPVQRMLLRDILHIGDRLKAVVKYRDIDALRIEIDCCEWLRIARSESRKQNTIDESESGKAPDDRVRVNIKTTPSPFEQARFLVVDDDTRLRRAIVDWLQVLGAQARYADSISVTEAAISEFQPSHILLDHDIKDFDKLLNLCAKSNVPTAIWSGNNEVPALRAKEAGLAFLAKPLNFTDLLRWCDQPGSYRPETRLHWADDDKELARWTGHRAIRDIRKDAEALLERLCSRHGLAGAVWIREAREQYFDFRVWTGRFHQRDLRNIEPDLTRSVGAHAIRNNNVVCNSLPSRDPLYPVVQTLGVKTPFYLAVPIVNEKIRPRVVIFFKDGAFDKSSIVRISDRMDHFSLLVLAIQQADHLDDVQTFATQGLLGSSGLHEIKNNVNLISAEVELAAAHLTNNKPLQAQDMVEKARAHLTHLDTIVHAPLTQISKFRREQFNPFRLAKDITDTMRRAKDGVHGKQSLSLVCKSPDAKLSVSLPPAAVEQPLINVIDNAIHHTDNASYGRIEVQVFVDNTLGRMDVCIDVTDNGKGMTAAERDTAFEPRQTSKGEKGCGLGLFVSRNLLQSIGGELELVDSIRWAGSLFRIRFPLTLTQMDDAEEKQ